MPGALVETALGAVVLLYAFARVAYGAKMARRAGVLNPVSIFFNPKRGGSGRAGRQGDLFCGVIIITANSHVSWCNLICFNTL